ncbi:palmitoyl-monogalactosyldiacylglycerol delta-7 desaturase, chloroplastic-like [Papaver somniferum]|uniref:palmitoyl-monogalactosyldiacylglycerol delta-7 desaturase, chloroplastic-like n=1 Tax=Papaver somniferum TaxID=3469 RepID=UPI000E6F7008|nr:palmitoyl-monogalactosyldiacylglycerol delta-7 desaturase, chloroplastic-like [Papaver somniferum]
MAVDRVYDPKGLVQLKQTKKDLFLSKRKGVFWDCLNLGAVTVEHIGLLFAPFYFTWNAFWVAVILFLLTFPIGISLSYHRNLSHGSFKLPKPLEYLFASFGLHAAEGEPMFWVSSHRYHHQFTDSVRDPHSPIEGFWFSHITWVFHNKYIREKCGKSNNVLDLKKQAYYRFLRKSHFLHLLGLALILYSAGGLPHLIWETNVRLAYGHHCTFMVNSVCHIWGKKPWNTKDLSKNNWVVGYLAFGEGWHNNHHAFEFSARLGLEWWQVDVPWYMLRLLEYLGLATNVKVPTEFQKQNYSIKIHNEFQ